MPEKRTIERARKDDYYGTDESSLVERIEHRRVTFESQRLEPGRGRSTVMMIIGHDAAHSARR